MMKQQHSATSLSPSRLCRWLMLAAFIKLAVLALIFTNLLPTLPTLYEKDAVAKALEATPLPKTANAPQPKEQQASSEQTQALGVAVANAQEAAPAQQPAPEDSLSREAMQQRQDELAKKEQDLRAIEKSIDAKLEDLKTLEGKLQSMLKEADSLKDNKYRHLVDVYSNMKAKQAAQVIETLDEKIAVKILSGMKGRQAGEILTFVLPAKAARLSEALTKLQMSFD